MFGFRWILDRVAVGSGLVLDLVNIEFGLDLIKAELELNMIRTGSGLDVHLI